MEDRRSSFFGRASKRLAREKFGLEAVCLQAADYFNAYRNTLMEHFEVEVKFYLKDIGPIRRRIIELGAACRGRFFETNMRFEDANKSLIKRGSLLRLRKDAKIMLTYKENLPVRDDQFKICRELEVEVSDLTTMRLILESLGFFKEQVYEKWRETFDLNGINCCIDEMPYGNFLEIEGKKEVIKDLANNIGLKWEKRILESYLEMFDVIRRKTKIDFSDLTFADFKNIKIDLEKYLHLLEAGKKQDNRI